jgi:sec-independent protein translocase protein TatB
MSLGWAEVGVLLLLTLFVVGPDRLPTVARDAGKALRSLRTSVKGLTDDLKTELGPEFKDVDLQSLHPRTFVQKHLLSDDDTSTFDLLGGAAGAGTSTAGAALAPGEQPPWDPDTT